MWSQLELLARSAMSVPTLRFQARTTALFTVFDGTDAVKISLHRHHYLVVPCCSIGHCPLLLTGLHCAGPICSTTDQCIASRQKRGPLPRPEYPGVLRQRRLQLCRVPCYTSVNAYLDLLYATIPCEGDASHLHRLTACNITIWVINTAHSV